MIFSNTTPFIALSAIGRLDLLPALFGRIHVVEPVVGECAAGGVMNVPALESLPWVTVQAMRTQGIFSSAPDRAAGGVD